MKPRSIEEMLKQDAAPPADPAARRAARDAAMAEFTRLNATAANETLPPRRSPLQALPFKALLDALRLSRESNSRGSDVMPWYSRRMLLGGAASVCLVIVGGTLVWKTQQVSPEVARLEPAASAPQAPAAPAAEPAAAARNDAPVNAQAGQSQIDARAQAQDAQAKAREADELAKLKSEHETTVHLKGQEAISPPPAPTQPIIPEMTDAAPAISAAAEPAEKKDEESQEVVVTGARRPMQASMTSPQPVVEIDDGRGRSVQRGPAGKTLAAVPSASRMSGNDQAGMLAANEAPPPPPASASEGRDKFEHFELNSIKQPAIESERVSTFSADVDSSSYSFVRKQLDQGVLPQKDAVRAEEMINYFDYSWPAAESREKPFRPTVVVSDSPWGKGRKLIHIGIKGYELPETQRPDANLVMLIDVSGSMDEPDKLPLVKQSMKLLLGSLKPRDTVAIVVYAGAAGMVLPPTPVGEKEKIIEALDRLEPGGSTAGAEGIELAYQLAEKSFRKEGVNRIMLCTDGDFNVGIDSTNELKGFVERKRKTGIFLSVLGFGQGNYRDELAQALAQNGNGVAAYIDTLNEARKVLVQEAGSSLFTIAKDVKLQVEFNPATVAEYRLVGYETRALKREDFNNDAVDAGDVGSGHAVTAIYEITPVGSASRMIDASRYVKPADKSSVGTRGEYGYLKIRYKLPTQSTSQLIETPITIDSGKVSESIRRDVDFSTAVAGFAQLLRGGQFTGSLSYEDVIKQALAARGADPYGYRNEFVQMVRKAQSAR